MEELITINEVFSNIPNWFFYINIFSVISTLISIISLWKLFEKAEQPGWISIVPVYNIIVILQIINKPVWWVFLLFVPLVNIIIIVLMNYYIVKVFDKNLDFFLGVLFLPFIFYPILAFGDSQYIHGRVDMNPDLGKLQTQVQSPVLNVNKTVASVESGTIDSTKNNSI